MSPVVQFLVDHQGSIGMVVIGFLDLIFALKPDWKSNGILHWIYLQVQKLLSKAPPSAPQG